MPHVRPLRFVAALFAFCAASSLAATPAAAQPQPSESRYAAVLQTINPALSADRARSYARSVMADAWRTHLDPRFIMSIVTVESHWRANAVSRVGARGLGQLMPGTAATLGVNPRNAAENLRGTSSYLRELVAHFAGKPNAMKLAIAGYNAGPKAVERFGGIPPYAETRNYVVRVLHVWGELNGKVGRAFVAPANDTRIAAREALLPDERAWLSDSDSIFPASSAPVVPVAASVTTESAK